VGEIAPGGHFVTYQIWGRLQFPGGDFCRLEDIKILD